jgi:hypothetical protein
VFTQIRTADAPRAQRFELDLPAGAELSATPGGGAEVTQGGDASVTIPPPSASDAAGNAVDVELTVVGDDAIELEVAPTESTVYPILADPSFIADYSSWDMTTGFSSWEPATTSPNYQTFRNAHWSPSQTPGLDITSSQWAAGGSPSPSHAFWTYYVPRYFSDLQETGQPPASYINLLYAGGVYFLTHGSNANYPALVLGTRYDYVGWQSYGVHYGGQGDMSGGTNSFWFYNENESTGVHMAQMDLVSWENENPTRWRDAYTAVVSVGLTDQNRPQIGLLQEPPSWVDQDPVPIPFRFSDNGLGVKTATVYGLLDTGEWKPWATNFCGYGTTQSVCPRVVGTGMSNPPLTYDPSHLPTGERPLSIVVNDPLEYNGPTPAGTGSYEHRVTQEVPVYVDHIDPVLQLSGSATAQGPPRTCCPQLHAACRCDGRQPERHAVRGPGSRGQARRPGRLRKSAWLPE